MRHRKGANREGGDRAPFKVGEKTREFNFFCETHRNKLQIDMYRMDGSWY